MDQKKTDGSHSVKIILTSDLRLRKLTKQNGSIRRSSRGRRSESGQSDRGRYFYCNRRVSEMTRSEG